MTLSKSSQGGDAEWCHPPRTSLGSDHGPGPGMDPAAPREVGAGVSAGGFWQQMGFPGRERELSHARVSKQDGNSQSRLLNKKALSRAACCRGGDGSSPMGPPQPPAFQHGDTGIRLPWDGHPSPALSQGMLELGAPGDPQPRPQLLPQPGVPGCLAPVAGGRHASCAVCAVRAACPSPLGPLTDNRFPRAGERHTVQTHQALNANFPNVILQSAIIESQGNFPLPWQWLGDGFSPAQPAAASPPIAGLYGSWAHPSPKTMPRSPQWSTPLWDEPWPWGALGCQQPTSASTQPPGLIWICPEIWPCPCTAAPTHSCTDAWPPQCTAPNSISPESMQPSCFFYSRLVWINPQEL